MMSDLRIATRGSRLALSQAKHVAALISAAHADVEPDLVEVTTSGDRDHTTSVTTLTEIGAFVRAIQEALLDGRADLAVHSCKDLPVAGPEELVSFYPARERPWDVLCGHDLDSLPERARVGTGSPRRAAQMRLLRPDVEVVDIRGNVDTRLQKMHDGEFDAVILAEAGLRRLEREAEVGHRFTPDEMVPAPAQGALAVEVLHDSPAAEIVETIDDSRTRSAVEAERALLSLTRTGCRSALGALGVVTDAGVEMTGFVEDERGARRARSQGFDPEESARRLREALEL
jgi:hydroxymethylbilane synthase